MQTSELVKKPIGIIKNSTISDVIKKLLENNISRLVVLESGKPVGIISEKDVGLFLFDDATKQGLDGIQLEKIMHEIEYIDEQKTIEECAGIMSDKKFSSLMIGNKEHPLGIFTKTDLVKYYSENYVGKNKITDFMTREYIFTHSAAPLFKVVRKMLENKVSRVIVKNQNEQPVGVISFRDLFRISLELGSDEDSGNVLVEQVRRGFLSEEGFGGVSLANEVMSDGIITIKFHEDLADACKLMLENNVNGLAVLDGNGSLAGIVSKTDVIRALASS